MSNSKWHIVCVDEKDVSKENQIKDKWRKNWFAFSAVQRVLRWPDFLENSLLDCSLVFIHRSAMSHDDTEFFEQLKQVVEKLSDPPSMFSVGIVSAGSSAKHAVSHQGRVCVLETPFGMELSSLADRVGRLFSEISDAQCDAEKLKHAWVNFDKADSPCESLVSLSILCQGYLAAEALIDSHLVMHGPTDDVGKALIVMGWTVANEDSLELSDDVADLGVAVQDNLPGIEYWLEPFDPEGTKKWPKVLSELRKQLEVEFKKEVPEAVTELLGAIEMTIESGGDAESSTIDPAVVARAFSSFFSATMEART